MPAKQGSQKMYSPESKGRAVTTVFEIIAETEERGGAIGRVARQLGIGDQWSRTWVAQAEVEDGKRAGLVAEKRAELKQPRKEVRELRRS